MTIVKNEASKVALNPAVGIDLPPKISPLLMLD